MPIRITDLVRGMADAKRSRAPVAITAAGALAIYVFLELAEEIDQGELAGIDRALLLALRNPADANDPLGPPWLERTVADITTLGGYPVLVSLVAVVVGYLLVVRRFGPALFVFLSTWLGTLVSQIMKQVYDRPRPDVVEHLVSYQTASFPSGHATMSTVVYLTLASLIAGLVDDWRVRAYVLSIAIVLSLVVGISRVYLGVHWPSDVAAGWALGAAWASLAWLVVSALRVFRHRQAGRA